MADFKKGKGVAQGECVVGHAAVLAYSFGEVVIVAPDVKTLAAAWGHLCPDALDVNESRDVMVFPLDVTHSVH